MSATLDIHGSVKPRLRGVIHSWSIVPFAIAGLLLVGLAPNATARVGAAVYVLAVTGMFAASSCYHRLPVSPSARKQLRRLDHSMIGVTIAGTYTPVLLLVLNGALRTSLLAVLWTGALAAMAVTMLWSTAPNWFRATLYVAVGLSGVAATPWLFTEAGVAAFVLVLAGAALYIAGALVYALRRPNPWPMSFGFHEVFHTFVTAAVACHFAAVCTVIAQTA